MASSKLKAWVSAARPRTLPLSISGILTGTACAYIIGTNPEYLGKNNHTFFDPYFTDRLWLVCVLGLLTTVGFQVLSNFANDYGDGVKGTDNDSRVGPVRAIQSGLIQPRQMKVAVIVSAILSFISALSLIIVSLGLQQLLTALVFLILGIAAIWAAIKYTVGADAYGYSGLGDLFVFIFFGPVSVMGIYYLILQELNIFLILPSLVIGLLSVAVLNLNNMRDVVNDKLSGKNTIVVKMGFENAKSLHLVILTISFVSALLYLIHLNIALDGQGYKWLYISLVTFIPIVFHAKKVRNVFNPNLLDPELKKVALSTFFFAFTFLVITICITAIYR